MIKMWTRRVMWSYTFEMWAYLMFSSDSLSFENHRHFFWCYLNWNQFEM